MMCRGILLLVTALGAAGVPSFATEDKPIDLKEVPAAVREVARKIAPEIKFTRAILDGPAFPGEARKYYRLKGKDPKGRTVEVASDDSAESVEVTITAAIALKDVPRSVIETHAKTTRKPGRFHFTATKIIRGERSKVGSDTKTIFYDFIGKNAKGELLHHEIHEDGTELGLGEAIE